MKTIESEGHFLFVISFYDVGVCGLAQQVVDSVCKKYVK